MSPKGAGFANVFSVMKSPVGNAKSFINSFSGIRNPKRERIGFRTWKEENKEPDKTEFEEYDYLSFLANIATTTIARNKIIAMAIKTSSNPIVWDISSYVKTYENFPPESVYSARVG